MIIKFKVKGYKGFSNMSLIETKKNVMMKINGGYIQSFKDIDEAMQYVDKYYHVIPQENVLKSR